MLQRMPWLQKIEENLRGIFEIVPTIPDEVSSKKLGETADGTDIIGYAIGKGSHPILFFGGTHGNEPSSVKTMISWIYWLHRNRSLIPANLKIIVIPCLNIDGYNRHLTSVDQYIGHYNSNNLDLNRNWPTSDFEYASPNEIKVLLNLIHDYNIRIIFSHHGGYSRVWATHDTTAQRLGQQFASHTSYKMMHPNKHTKKNHDDARLETGHLLTWGTENNVSIIEIDGAFQNVNEWPKQSKALISILNLVALEFDTNLQKVTAPAWSANPIMSSEN